MASTNVSPAPANTDPPNASMGPGTVLVERFLLEEQLGESSIGKVYVAQHLFLKKKLVVKVLRPGHPDQDELSRRFEHEAMRAASLEEPHLAKAVDFGALNDGTPFFVSEHVSGTPLREELGKGPLALRRSLEIARQIASALAAANELDLLHGDLRPENLMLLRQEDESDLVKVLDFALAPLRVSEATRTANEKRLLYLAPEQLLGEPIDARADLYALGVILFEMLAGVKPYSEPLSADASADAAAPTFAARAPKVQVPHDVEQLVQKLINRKVSERVASAVVLVESLNGLIGSLATPGTNLAPTVQPAVIAKKSSPPEMAFSKTTPPPPPVRQPRPTGAAPSVSPAATPSASPAAAPSVPPPAEPPTAIAAAKPLSPGATLADAADDDAPTRLALPKISVPPPGPELDAQNASERPAPSPAQSLTPPMGQATPAPAQPRFWEKLDTKAWPKKVKDRAGLLYIDSSIVLGQWRDRAQKKLHGRRGRLVAATAAGAALGLAVIAFFALRSPSPESAENTQRNETELATTEPESAEAATPASNALAAAPAAKAAPAPAIRAASGALDEVSVFLNLASSYASERKDSEAVALVSRVLLRQPELKNDSRVAKVLSRTVRSESRQAADESFAQLSGPMGEAGAEIIYGVANDSTVRDSLRKRSEDWLNSKDFDRTSSAALYSAVKLRYAKNCEQKRALLPLAADVGGKQTLEYLRDLDARIICRPNDLTNCFPCMAGESRLKDAIARVEKRVGL